MSFPPPNIDPPHERSAHTGDGEWTPLGDAQAGDRAAKPPPVMYRTVLHPHEASRFISVTLAVIDQRAVEVHYMPGTDDVQRWEAPPEVGLVPKAQQADLLAVFNGGFQPKHGRWGMFAHGQQALPPREEGCTVGVLQNGRVKVGPWPQMEPEELVAYRQTPPCLLEDGQEHPKLEKGQDRLWAGQTPDITTRRRSAVGVDASGRYLFYAVGMEADPLLLARAMKMAGARNAAQLDINWAWTRFILYGTRGDDELRTTSSLVDQMVYGKRSYIVHASERDFFFITKKR